MIELHCHTTFSDGTLTPTQLVEAAIVAGVKALAITDHDSIAGWDEAYEAATAAYDRLGYALEIVPGLELSTTHQDRSLHILGFYPQREKIEMPLQNRIAGRHRRAAKMVEKLANLGYPIALPSLGTDQAPGRPHIAQALVEAGYVKSVDQAFDRFLGETRPAYVPYDKLSTVEGIQLLRACGAIPVWAHAYLFRGGAVESCLPEFVEAGLMGLEVYHPHHSISQIDRLKQLCKQYNLVMTGGSDYHGPGPDQRPGKTTETKPQKTHAPDLNTLNVPMELLTALKRAAQDLRYLHTPENSD